MVLQAGKSNAAKVTAQYGRHLKRALPYALVYGQIGYLGDSLFLAYQASSVFRFVFKTVYQSKSGGQGVYQGASLSGC
jgi:Na+/H+ antiporter NhaB